MHCFTHQDNNAIGICKTCGKGLCVDCAVSNEFPLACSGKCAEEAAHLREMNKRGMKIYGIGTNTKSKIASGVIMWGGMCLFFTGYGAFNWFKYGELQPFWLAYGVFCLGMTYLAYRRTKELGIQC